MPGGDRTGPQGMGPMTGRGMGYCADYDVPGSANPIPGGGMGFGRRTYGRGGGRGRRNRYYATGIPQYPVDVRLAPPISREDEIGMLKAESQRLAQALEQIGKRIESLESEKKKE